jgi:hypothetical protein
MSLVLPGDLRASMCPYDQWCYQMCFHAYLWSDAMVHEEYVALRAHIAERYL